jgi:fused signal recognition particle receptor
VLLVLDATTGQNALSQAEMFIRAADVTGTVLTKLDGTAKGGIVVNLSHTFHVPLRFIGIGEQISDLQPFDPEKFIDALF